jgi:hypothetical protein
MRVDVVGFEVFVSPVAATNAQIDKARETQIEAMKRLLTCESVLPYFTATSWRSDRPVRTEHPNIERLEPVQNCQI